MKISKRYLYSGSPQHQFTIAQILPKNQWIGRMCCIYTMEESAIKRNSMFHNNMDETILLWEISQAEREKSVIWYLVSVIGGI